MNALESYKKRIAQALAPEISRRNANPSVSTAKKVLSEYTKVIGDPIGIIELRMFWCETAVQFSMAYGFSDAGYFDALVTQFGDVCKLLPSLQKPLLTKYIERMENVRDDANMGYGVGDEMGDILGNMLINLPESLEEARVPMFGE